MEEDGKTKNTVYNWPPLEGDPQIFNKFSYKVGLKDNFTFTELISMDYKSMEVSIVNPVKAVIANVEYTEKANDISTYITENSIKKYDDLPFFMSQEGELDDACGLIAILQPIGNLIDEGPYSSNTILSKFFDSTKDLDPSGRAKFLENYNEFKEMHIASAEEGQTDLNLEEDDITNHFISFIYHKGYLVELDGLLEGPHFIKEIKEEELLDEVIFQLRKRLEMELITESLSIMYLEKKS